MRLKQWFASVLAACMALSLPCAAQGKQSAQNIVKQSTVSLSGTADSAELLRDGDEATRVRFANGGTIELENTKKTAALYLVWDVAPAKWQVETSGSEVAMGQSRFLHQYAKLPAGQATVKLRFEGAAVLCELQQLTAGAPPADVQDWKPPLKDADMLLLPTHADDELLYFGGTIPTYTARKKAVQVAYMVNHKGEPHRQHELLNGLWAAGVRNYPVISSLPDFYSSSLEHAKTIYDAQAVLAYQVELIRRFQPEVIVGHDVNGEYGHGAHMLSASMLQQAVVAAADKQQYPESASRYGAWDTPKTYLHLWPERAVVMNWSAPLAAFGNATAYEVAVKAFSRHASQQPFFKVEKSGPYDCRKFGLFRTTVGDDVKKKDFFEHIGRAG